MNKKKDNQIPQFLRPFLWSYDLSGLDLEIHKNIIIKNILDAGNEQATDWMKKTYSDKEIKDAIIKSFKSDWSRKSINFWSLVYRVSPEKEKRF